MSDFGRCKKCKEYGFMDRHKCLPIMHYRYKGIDEEWLDDDWNSWEEIRAKTHYQAAMKFAEKYNGDGDYALMDEYIDVIISDGTIEKTFTVTAEADILYDVEEKKEKSDE